MGLKSDLPKAWIAVDLGNIFSFQRIRIYGLPKYPHLHDRWGFMKVQNQPQLFLVKI